MTTIGYGDMYPRNSKERLFVAIVTILSCGIFGYTMNSIGQIIAEQRRESNQFKIKMNLLVKQMNQRNLNQLLQKRVRNYYEYLHDKRNNFDEESEKLLQNLPQSIRQEVNHDMNIQILSSHKIFSLQFTKKFQQDISMYMKILKIGPEINIITQNDSVISHLYFVHDGNVDISIKLEQQTKSLCSLKVTYFIKKNKLYRYIQFTIKKKGDMFGEVEFFSQRPSLISAKTQNVVTLGYIEFQDFMTVLKDNPLDYVVVFYKFRIVLQQTCFQFQEKYFLIKDKINIYQEKFAIDQKCFGCRKYGHSVNECRTINLDYKKTQLILNYQNGNNDACANRNSTIQRSRINKYVHPYLTMNNVASKLNEFITNNKDQVKNYRFTYKLLKYEKKNTLLIQTIQEILDVENSQQYIFKFQLNYFNKFQQNSFDSEINAEQERVSIMQISGQNKRDSLQKKLPYGSNRKSQKKIVFAIPEQRLLNQGQSNLANLDEILGISEQEYLDNSVLINESTHNIGSGFKMNNQSKSIIAFNSNLLLIIPLKNNLEAVESPIVSQNLIPLINEFNSDNNEKYPILNKICSINCFDKRDDYSLKYQQINSFIPLNDFDKHKIYKLYFPFNNIDIILSQIRKAQRIQRLKSRKTAHVSTNINQ